MFELIGGNFVRKIIVRIDLILGFKGIGSYMIMRNRRYTSDDAELIYALFS